MTTLSVMTTLKRASFSMIDPLTCASILYALNKAGVGREKLAMPSIESVDVPSFGWSCLRFADVSHFPN